MQIQVTFKLRDWHSKTKNKNGIKNFGVSNLSKRFQGLFLGSSAEHVINNKSRDRSGVGVCLCKYLCACVYVGNLTLVNCKNLL